MIFKRKVRWHFVHLISSFIEHGSYTTSTLVLVAHVHTYTKDLHWGTHIQATPEKADKTSTFMHHNLKGSPIMIQTNCYNSIRAWFCPSWSLSPPHGILTSSTCLDALEKVHRPMACRILQGYCATSSASALVSCSQIEVGHTEILADSHQGHHDVQNHG